MNILALSGSLRRSSLNSMLLRAAARLAPADIRVELYPSLAAIPLFNPDLDPEGFAPVSALRAGIVSCEAVLIASPEYARGVSGVMKNALDWMVGNESFVDKPVGLLNTSARATVAYAALQETLITMSARVIPAACVTVALLGSGLDEDAIVHNPLLSAAVRGALSALADAAGSF
ncbi:MAG TPA: NADPH-dependent FMN reductase [Steroidobacteraceae bacterium]|nr:NADPH-dependent FMN reductase [Steroidobacteraceae bacterium]